MSITFFGFYVLGLAGCYKEVTSISILIKKHHLTSDTVIANGTEIAACSYWKKDQVTGTLRNSQRAASIKMLLPPMHKIKAVDT